MESTPSIPNLRTATSHELPLPPVLRTYWVWMIALTAISAVASDIFYYRNIFTLCCTLADDDALFTDLWCYHFNFRFVHTAAFFQMRDRFAYPAFSAVVYNTIYNLGRHAQAIFLTFELSVCSLAAYLFFRKIRHTGLRLFPAAILVITTLIFSYPLLYMFGSGSIEIVTCIFTAAGLWAMFRKQDNLAAVLWGAAAALKIYPIILLGLFLSRAKARSLAVGIAAFAIISVLSMWFIGPTIPMAFAGSVSGVTGFVSSYVAGVRTQELPFDHSLLSPFKTIAFIRANRWGSVSYLTNPYLLLAGTTALLAFFLRAWRMPIANRVLFFFAAMVALPPVSYDHTLVHLYAPWAMLVIIALRTGTDQHTLPGLRTLLLCFAVLFTSQRFLHYHWIHPNGTLKAIALVVILVTALRYPIPDEILFEQAPALSHAYPITAAT